MAETDLPKYFSPGQVSEILGIPKTTLFRWEAERKLVDVTRASRRGRHYHEGHLDRLFELVREQEIKYSPDGLIPPEAVERISRAELVLLDRFEGAKELGRLVESGRVLDDSTIDIMARSALNRPRGHELRTATWRLIIASDKISLGGIRPRQFDLITDDPVVSKREGRVYMD